MYEHQKDYRLRTRYYSPSLNPQAKSIKKKKRQLRLTALSLALGAALTLGLYAFIANPKTSGHFQASLSSGISNITDPDKSNPITGSADSSISTMNQTINSIISSDNDVDTSVSLVNLDNDQTEHYGDDDTFQAASTAKILTAEYFLHEVEEGKQSLSENVDGFTAQYELKQMIVVSDDTAWINLDNLLGNNNLQNYVDQTFDTDDFDVNTDSLSSADIADAMSDLWKGNILDAEDRSLLLSYLEQANYRQFIVPAIPSSDTIYHKIGLYQDYVNEAAIVTNNNKAFALVIFTNGNSTYDWPARATMMQDIAKAALKAYFNQG